MPCTGLPNKACTWFGELCSCPCLVSRNKLHQTTYKPYSGALYVHGAMATLEALISSVARVAESRPSMVSLEEILFTHSHSRKFLGTCFHSKFPATFCHWPSRKMDNSLPKGVPNSLQKVTNRVVLVPRNAVHTFCKKT